MLFLLQYSIIFIACTYYCLPYINSNIKEGTRNPMIDSTNENNCILKLKEMYGSFIQLKNIHEAEKKRKQRIFNIDYKKAQ